MKRIRILPYKMGNSYSLDVAKELRKRGYDCLRVYPDRNYKPKFHDLIINWGSSEYPEWNNGDWAMLNMPENISLAVNKLVTFSVLSTVKGVNIPEYTAKEKTAREWLEKGKAVVGRKLLSSFGGRGIVMMESPEDFVSCPLYTLYKKKKKEFRVHVFNGKVIDVTEKRKRNGVKTDGKIRSWDNGWVFCHQNVLIEKEGTDMALQAVKSLGLDFGAVDMIWNEFENKYYVLEINTAPGIQGTTVTKYADAIEELAK